MKIQVLFFGELRESVQCAQDVIEIDTSELDVAGLVNALADRGPAWQVALKAPEPLRVAVNQEMAALHTPLADGAEVAFFRPVTGG